jgi:hypothetical protein
MRRRIRWWMVIFWLTVAVSSCAAMYLIEASRAAAR